MYLLCDIGGTYTRIALSLDGEGYKKPFIFNTPQDFGEGIESILEVFHRAADGYRIKAISVGIAGALDVEKTKILRSPNLRNWEGKPIKRLLQSAFHVPIFIENDADMAGLGEAVNGAGKYEDIVVYLTVSTGIGGTRIVNKYIDRNILGFEPGHQFIQVNAKDRSTKNFEQIASGTAIKKNYKKEPKEITDPEVWNEIAFYIACGVHNTILHWSPDIVVLGGSIMKKVQLSLVRRYLNKIMYIFPEIPEIKPSKLKYPGLDGALVLLNQKNTSANRKVFFKKVR
jgi:predicted NBD/HSP70 family sugar kinase